MRPKVKTHRSDSFSHFWLVGALTTRKQKWSQMISWARWAVFKAEKLSPAHLSCPCKPGSGSPGRLSWCAWYKWAVPRTRSPPSSPPPCHCARSVARCRRQLTRRWRRCREGLGGNVAGWQLSGKAHSGTVLHDRFCKIRLPVSTSW